MLAVVGWGLAITAFGLVTFSFPLALLCLALAGAADVFSAVFRSTLVQLETPDALRGRVMSIHGLVVTSGPRIGDIEAAAVASRRRARRRPSCPAGSCACWAWSRSSRLFPELVGHTIRPRTGAPRPTEASLESDHVTELARDPPAAAPRDDRRVAGSPGSTPRATSGSIRRSA